MRAAQTQQEKSNQDRNRQQALPSSVTKESLFKASSQELKFLIRRYGCAEINRRLRGES